MVSAEGLIAARVLLEQPALPDCDLLRAACKKTGVRISRPRRFVSDTEPRCDSLRFGCRGAEVVATLMPVPMPSEELAEACEAAWAWPEAAAVVATHRAHLVVVLASKATIPARAGMLTRVLAALAEVGRAVAVVWSPAGFVHSAASWIEHARRAGVAGIPVRLWFSLRHRVDPGGGDHFYSDGLPAFGHLDFEINEPPANPERVMDQIAGFLGILLARDRAPKSGEVLKLASGRPIVVEHRPSHDDPPVMVMHLTY